MDIGELDSKIAKEFKENKCSLFRAAIELSDVESVRTQLKSSLLPLPHLRIACLLRDFYDYADGRNYRDLWRMHNANADLDKTWEYVYHCEGRVNQYEVKSKAWILSGVCHGQASDIWRVIKACSAKKSEDGADRFDASSYVNDEVPQQTSLILDNYQSGGVEGAEFVSFIEAFQRRRDEPDDWMATLVSRAREHFPSSVDFTAAGYLQWDIGSERAEMILGVDHVRGVVSGHLSINGEVKTATIAAGFKGFALPPAFSESHEVHFLGVTERIPASPIGVYYRYQLGADARKSWWVRVREDGVFPYNRGEILLVLPDGYNGPVELGSGFVAEEFERTRGVACSGRRYLFAVAQIRLRPDTAKKIEVGNLAISFAGIAPEIRLGTEPARSIWAEDAVVVDAATSVEISGLTDSMSCTWTVNGAEVGCDGCRLDLPTPQGGLGESRVKATIRKDGRICRRLGINVFHVPFQIAEALRYQTALPAGWSVQYDEKGEDCIALRVSGRRAAFLEGPNNVVLPIYVEDHSCAWWIERDAVCNTVTDSFREVSSFTRISDLEGARFCVPADMPAFRVEVAERNVDVSRWQQIPKDGVIQIPLDKIVGDASGREFCFDGNVPELKFSLDGHLVGTVAAVPKSPTLCRHANNQALGVFLPNRTMSWSEKFLVLAYRDTPDSSELYPEQLTAEPLEWKRNGGDQFVSVAEKLDAYLEGHPRGEVFVVLVNARRWNKYSCTVFNPFFLRPETDCQILVVRTDSSPYTAEEAVVAKRLKGAWGEDLSALAHGHPLKRTRISLFKGAISYEECRDYWRDVAAMPQEWKTAFRVMLDSGYNPLMEPDWFNQSVDELIDKVRVRERKGRQEVLKVLLDNQDAKSERFSRGDGLCAALVSRRQILKFSDLVPDGREACFLNREQTILSSRPMDGLGILGVFEDRNGGVVRHPLVRAGRNEGEIEIVFKGSGGQEVIQHRPRGGWRRTDNRIGLLSFRAFELSEPNQTPRLFSKKTADIDRDDAEWARRHCNEDEYRQLIEAGKSLSARLDQSLNRPWIRDLFSGTFDALKSKGCCDVAIARAVGLTVCVQSILGDKNRGACLKAKDAGYALVLRLTRSLFHSKFDEGDGSLWRETMRFITAFLGLHAYLDIDPEHIQDNDL